MRAVRVACGLTFLAAGLNHFRVPKVYRSIMPDYLPAHHELVLASGVAEAVGGAGLLVPAHAARRRLVAARDAGRGLPGQRPHGPPPRPLRADPALGAVARLPFQLVFGAWVAAAMRARLISRERATAGRGRP